MRELASDVALPFLGFTSFIRRAAGSSRAVQLRFLLFLVRNTRRVQPRSCRDVGHLDASTTSELYNSLARWSPSSESSPQRLLARINKTPKRNSCNTYVYIPRLLGEHHCSETVSADCVRSHFTVLPGIRSREHDIRASILRTIKTTVFAHALSLFLSLSLFLLHVNRLECALLTRRCTNVPIHNQLSPITRRLLPFFPGPRALPLSLSLRASLTHSRLFLLSAPFLSPARATRDL